MFSRELKTADFIRNEVSKFASVDSASIKAARSSGFKTFVGRIEYCVMLAWKEKEIFFFAALQWLAVILGYLLFIQIFSWIPQEVWESLENRGESEGMSYLVNAWLFVCIGLVAMPVGIFTACMGATHFLHQQRLESTVPRCLQIVLPRSWSLWLFHWLDGYITVSRILSRLDKEADPISADLLYYSWKIGSAGVLPGLITGDNMIQASRRAIFFVKNYLMDVVKLRAGYSACAWLLGIATYIGTLIFMLFLASVVDDPESIFGSIYAVYMWATIPLAASFAVLMLILRPIYVLAICDLYSQYAREKDIELHLPNKISNFKSALTSYACLICAVIICILFAEELGITAILTTPAS